jgi:uncharacterized protein YcbK (DUF882 family)
MMRLMPDFALVIERVRRECERRGVKVIITQAYRSMEYQAELRRCWADPECRRRRGIVAEPAPPERTYHTAGRAIDFEPIPKTPENRALVGKIAEQFGLRYGGRFGDPVHIDDGRRLTPEEAHMRCDERYLVEVSIT